MKILRVFAVSALAFASFACGPDIPSRAQPGETCFDSFAGDCKGRVVESCCAASTCAYRVSDGKDFPCNGSDCSAAANEVVAYCKQ